MDDARIRQLTQEVMARLAEPAAGEVSHDIEARVASLERAVFGGPRALPSETTAPAATTVVQVTTHPSHRFLRVAGGVEGEPCLLEPDKPCVLSGCCRTLGH